MNIFEMKSKIIHDDKNLEYLKDILNRRIVVLTTSDMLETYGSKINHLLKNHNKIRILLLDNDVNTICNNNYKFVSKIHSLNPHIILCFGESILFNEAKIIRYFLKLNHPSFKPIFLHIPLHLAGGFEITSWAYFIQDRQVTFINKPYLIPHVLLQSPEFAKVEYLESIRKMSFFAMIGAIDSYTSNYANVYSVIHSNPALKILNTNIMLLKEEELHEKLANLQVGSTLSGIATNQSSLGLSLLFSIYLQKYFDLPIEDLIPIVAPQIINFNMGNIQIIKSYSKLARKLDFSYADPEVNSQAFLENIKSIRSSLNYATKLCELGINYPNLIKHLESLSEDIYRNQHLAHNPLQLKVENIRRILLNIA